ncbi:MAG: SRPBCC family protein [Verrucomicrobiota bacterium]
MNIPPVRKSVLVRAPLDHTFATYVGGGWWPKQHSILASGSPQKTVILEPRAGGRWYEVGEDGSECVWGQVLAYEPPQRLLMTWQINGDFQLEPTATSEVEVIFTPEGDGTRVTLEHRGFENFLATGGKLRDAVDSDGGWGVLLGLMGAAASTVAAEERRYFLCKLIPPRPTFMQDMSDAERGALNAQVCYWETLLEQKRVVIFGPVGDPAGVWGLGGARRGGRGRGAHDCRGRSRHHVVSRLQGRGAAHAARCFVAAVAAVYDRRWMDSLTTKDTKITEVSDKESPL